MKTPSHGLGGSGVRSVGRGAGMILTGGSLGVETKWNGPGGMLTVNHGRQLPLAK